MTKGVTLWEQCHSLLCAVMSEDDSPLTFLAVFDRRDHIHTGGVASSLKVGRHKEIDDITRKPLADHPGTEA